MKEVAVLEGSRTFCGGESKTEVMSCGAANANSKYPGSEFDKLFASRFNELDSLISSSPSSPVIPAAVFAKSSSCGDCSALQMPSEGRSQSVLQWLAFFLLVVGIALLLMYIFKRLRKTRKSHNLFGSMVLPSVGQKSAGGTVATPPRDTTGQAKTPLGAGASESTGRVKIIKDPSQIVPSTAAKTQINMFFATWCGHCTAMKPQFMELAEKHPDLDFALVENTVMQQHPEAESFGVRGFPHVAAFLGKKQLGTLVGNQGPEKLHEFVLKMKAMSQK